MPDPHATRRRQVQARRRRADQDKHRKLQGVKTPKPRPCSQNADLERDDIDIFGAPYDADED